MKADESQYKQYKTCAWGIKLQKNDKPWLGKWLNAQYLKHLKHGNGITA